MNNPLEASQPINIKNNNRIRSSSLTSTLFEDSGSLSFGSYTDFKINKNKWMQDDMVNFCALCNQSFNWYYRKHHCRLCQRIFCAKCLNQQEVIDINLFLNNYTASSLKKFAQIVVD